MKPAKLGLIGKTPKATVAPIDPDKPRVEKKLTEREKYEKMWTVDEYRAVAPGELAANTFLSLAKPEADEEIIDFGCGTGRGALHMYFFGRMNVTMVDLAENCLDEDLKTACLNFPDRIRFQQHDMNEPLDRHAKYGYCTDVMEHIPEDEVDTVLDNILNSAQNVFFRISTTPDTMGPRYLRQPLHLSVHDYKWWAMKFLEHDVTILHSEDLGGAVDFYVTGYTSNLPTNVKVNTAPEKVIENIRENAKWGCNPVRAHMIQDDQEIMILAGGPSLNDFEDEILENYRAGMKVITVNGTYQWAQERGIMRVNQCMIDARPFNARFVEPPRDDCYYFIASQCDPSVFEKLPPERTFYWHVTGTPDAIEAIDECYPEYVLAGGGSTVVLRTIVLMRILGFKKMVIYGMDSCIRGTDHHAYEQKENDYKVSTIPVTIGGKTFTCQPWMAYQAFEFMDMVKTLGDEFMLDVKGDGLIAHILKTGAEMPEIEEP